jgi:hypothetical protein
LLSSSVRLLVAWISLPFFSPQEMTLAGGFYNNIVEINIILRLLSP